MMLSQRLIELTVIISFALSYSLQSFYVPVLLNAKLIDSYSIALKYGFNLQSH